ncbi:MAG: type III-B CRISPR module-associated protein Cmr3 [Candidatus Lokiarchaeota archaeon]|nr:type III-B CRISPR module-associated protein Cmr3 [Candidatus Lokiarchaeota archaeon]
MKLRIVPNDTLFFRDGKPFSMGDETWADGIFPPNPSTVYGSIRTKFITENGGLSKFLKDKMKNKIGTKFEVPENGFQIKAIFLGFSEETSAITDRYYFPAPLDIACLKDNADYILPLKPLPKAEIKTSCPLPQIISAESILEEIELPPKAFIHETAFYDRYFEGHFSNIRLTRIEDILLQEPKVGIGRDNYTRTSEEAMLYRVGMNRLKPEWSIYVEISGLERHDLISNDGDTTLIKLGGEGKTASTSIVDFNEEAKKPEELEYLKNSIRENKQFKIYFMTPAIFNNGWYPDFIGQNFFMNDFPQIEMIAAAVGKPDHIGGWDMGNNEPKPMRRAIAAGSVFFFNIHDTNKLNIEQIIQQFHRQNFGYNTAEGFGHCLMTIWR